MFKELNEESYEELKGCIVTMIDKMVDIHKIEMIRWQVIILDKTIMLKTKLYIICIQL